MTMTARWDNGTVYQAWGDKYDIYRVRWVSGPRLGIREERYLERAWIDREPHHIKDWERPSWAPVHGYAEVFQRAAEFLGAEQFEDDGVWPGPPPGARI